MVKKTAQSVAIAWNRREIELERRVVDLMQALPLLDHKGIYQLLKVLLA